MKKTPRNPLSRTLLWLLFGLAIGVATAVIRNLLGEHQSGLSIFFTVLAPTAAAGIAAGIKSSQK
ncbi:hypothetical protein [Arthrobacter sp. Y-9]|uniref:hypothetical protein n=1 Tax=Arthrobacter sp. Y-9 TaxID=3039385 RepID=UPI00241D36B1|nr:hypothetical protein [Arthrobacter sp. Y-9]WFR84509.1 hypothetical protein P9849_02360 [Arthrobacter sp. Y-9]